MINRLDLIREIAADTMLPTDLVKAVMDSLDKVAKREIQENGEFALKHIVTIRNKVIPARIARDPMTGERKWFPPVRALAARVCSPLKTAFYGSPAYEVPDGEVPPNSVPNPANGGFEPRFRWTGETESALGSPASPSDGTNGASSPFGGSGDEWA